MDTWSKLLAVLCGQLAVAFALSCVLRPLLVRGRGITLRSAEALGFFSSKLWLFAVVAALALAAISSLRDLGWGVAALFAVGLPSTLGCALLLHAGWLERGGRLGPARRLARLGGFLTVIGCVALSFVMVAYSALDQLSGQLSGIPRMGTLVLGLAGFAGLLSGLSGKPRPAGLLAALLYGVAHGLVGLSGLLN